MVYDEIGAAHGAIEGDCVHMYTAPHSVMRQVRRRDVGVSAGPIPATERAAAVTGLLSATGPVARITFAAGVPPG